MIILYYVHDWERKRGGDGEGGGEREKQGAGEGGGEDGKKIIR